MSVAREMKPERAIEALTWAADVAVEPALLDQKPERPTPAEWRAVPQPCSASTWTVC